jgi:ribosomal protein S17
MNNQMNNTNNHIDVSALPVHLFVKSQKEAKKIVAEDERTYFSPFVNRKQKRFKPALAN